MPIFRVIIHQKKRPATVTPKQGTKTDKSQKTSKVICKFYKNGHCNKEEGKCRFLHPKICRKFKQFGGVEDNNKGCPSNCGFFHPNACRSSLKNNTCTYVSVMQ